MWRRRSERRVENELWCRWSSGRVGEWTVMQVKQWKGWRMSCDVGKATKGLANELWALLILQPFLHFTYITAHSPTLLSLYLRHSSFSNPSVGSPMPQLILNPSFASPTSQALHLCHLVSCPWFLCSKLRNAWVLFYDLRVEDGNKWVLMHTLTKSIFSEGTGSHFIHIRI